MEFADKERLDTNSGVASSWSLQTAESSRQPGFQAELVDIRNQLALLVQGQAETQGAVSKINEGMTTILQQAKDREVAYIEGNDLQPKLLMPLQDKILANKIANNSDILPDRCVSDGLVQRQQTTGPRDMSLEQKAEIAGLLQCAKDEATKVEENRRRKKNLGKFVVWKYRSMGWHDVELWFDAVMAMIIVANGLFMGFSMDLADDGWGPWLAVDVVFSGIFICELLLKIFAHGFRGQFCGPSRASNIFDACLIFVDLTQLIMVLGFPKVADQFEDAPSASLFRIVRLAKLLRLLRLLRSEVFKDLLSMCQGLIGGMSTLVWSMVLFLLLVYVMALVFRELLGRQEKENITEYFNGVPRSMYTTFRCSFGDCSTAGGTPIFEYVTVEYGTGYTVLYCIFVFIVTIGVFNVISAIFVESTMHAATSLDQARKAARLADEVRWSTSISTLIREVIRKNAAENVNPSSDLTQQVDEVFATEVNGTDIDEVVKEEQAIEALNALDICPEDHKYLSDILDPDNTGIVPIRDFVDGLRRLRGDPRRSDIVSVDLMIRSLQVVIGNMQSQVNEIHSLVAPKEL